MPQETDEGKPALESLHRDLNDTFEIIRVWQSNITDALKEYKESGAVMPLRRHPLGEDFLDHYIDAARANALAIAQYERVSGKLETITGGSVVASSAAKKGIGDELAKLYQLMGSARKACDAPFGDAFELSGRAEHTNNETLLKLSSALTGATMCMAGNYADCMPVLAKICAQYPARDIRPSGK